MSEDDLLTRVKELSRQQIAEYLLTGEFDPNIENKLRRLQYGREEYELNDIRNADFSEIYQEINRRKVSDSN